MRRVICLCLFVLAGLDPAKAQGLGWLFGEPPSPHRARRHRIADAPVAVPLPPPRPHFPGDAPPAPSVSAAKAEPAEANPAAAPPSDVAAADKPSPTPLPPPKPAEFGGTAAPAATPPAPDAASGDKPATAGPGPTPLPSAPPLPPGKPAVPPPAVAPSGATTVTSPREPTPDAQCAARLEARGTVVEAATIGPQPDARCIVQQPMRLLSQRFADGSTVTFPDKPVIACITADAFSAYVRDLVAPLAKGTWGVALVAVSTGPGLECRSRDHIFGAKLSAHGQGLAVDIAQLTLADGRIVAVGDPKTDAERGFETAARAGGCGYFHTVLGPGSDSYHRTHWHFDLEVRGKDGDSKYCR